MKDYMERLEYLRGELRAERLVVDFGTVENGDIRYPFEGTKNECDDWIAENEGEQTERYGVQEIPE